VSERGQIRRRLREQRRLREALLLDLGALVYELHRQGRRAPELLQSKAAELTVVDDEVRELQAALEGRDAAPSSAETAEVEALGELPDGDSAPDEEPLRDEHDVGDDEADTNEHPALADTEDSRG
jgi:hypothetical protein